MLYIIYITLSVHNKILLIVKSMIYFVDMRLHGSQWRTSICIKLYYNNWRPLSIITLYGVNTPYLGSSIVLIWSPLFYDSSIYQKAMVISFSIQLTNHCFIKLTVLSLVTARHAEIEWHTLRMSRTYHTADHSIWGADFWNHVTWQAIIFGAWEWSADFFRVDLIWHIWLNELDYCFSELRINT